MTPSSLPRLGLACASCALIAACALDPDAPLAKARAAGDAPLTIALAGGVTTLDPIGVRTADEAALAKLLFRALVIRDEDAHDGVRPDLARAWRALDGARTWELELDPEARWSNGRALTAHDVVASWRHALAPSSHAPNVRSLFVLEGARELADGRLLRVVRATKPERTPFVVLGEAGALEPPPMSHLAEGTFVRALDSNMRKSRSGAPVPLRESPSADALLTALLPAGAEAVVVARQLFGRSGRGARFVELRAPNASRTGWAAESDLVATFPPPSLRRVLADPNASDRVPVRAEPRDDALVLVELEDDGDVELLDGAQGAFVRVRARATGHVGWVDRTCVEAIPPQRAWFFVEGLDGPVGGWVEADALTLDATRVGVRALDDHTVAVSLVAETPDFPMRLAQPVWRPVPLEVVERHGGAWTASDTLVTSSGARVARTRGGILLVEVGDAVFRFLERRDAIEALRLLCAGYVDVVAPGAVPPALWPALRTRTETRAGPLIEVRLSFAAASTRVPDAAARRALLDAIDPNEIARDALRGALAPVADHEAGKGGPLPARIVLGVPEDALARAVAAAVVDALGRRGVDVELAPLQGKSDVDARVEVVASGTPKLEDELLEITLARGRTPWLVRALPEPSYARVRGLWSDP